MKKEVIKILYITHSRLVEGGAERSLLTLLRGLDRERFDPIVVVLANGSYKDEIDKLGIKSYVIPLRWWIQVDMNSTQHQIGMMERSIEIASIIDAEGVNIVHSNTCVIAEGAIAAKLTGRIHVWHLHEVLEGHPSMNLSLPLFFTYKFIELMSDIVVVVSEAHKEAVAKWINKEKIIIIPNGVENFVDKDAESSLRDELQIPYDYKIVCTVGPVIKEKGYETFVDTAAKVLDEVKDVHFISAGAKTDCNLWDSLEELVEEKSLKEHVSFLGFRNDVRRILNEVDIYLLTSETETFSLATVEAMSVAKPIIATRCGGPEEIIVDGETGHLLPLKDSDALSKAIITLLRSPDEMVRLGANSKRRFEDLYTADRYINKFEQFYEGIDKKEKLDEDDEKFAVSLIDLVCSVPPAVTQVEKQVHDLQNSLSWRITAPLRKIMKSFLKLG